MFVIRSIAISGVAALASFMVEPSRAATFSTLYSFMGADGSLPGPKLLPQGHELYGTTTEGGGSDRGTVFALNRNTGIEKIVHSFGSGFDGAYPQGGLTPYSGLLFGTTQNGGSDNVGTVFSVDPKSGSEKVIYNFTNGADGAAPEGALAIDSGIGYGAIVSTSASYHGIIYKVNLSTGAESVLYSFKGGADQGFPGPFLLLRGSEVYGVTKGIQGTYGTVFKINTKTGEETTLYSFRGGIDGAYPLGNLVYNDGILYGTTTGGGSYNDGAIFALNLATQVETVGYSFNVSGGASPSGLAFHQGVLFGAEGGVSGLGAIYEVDLKTWTQTILYNFTGGADGRYPNSDLLFSDGAVYGTTGYGDGTVFKIVP